MSVFIGPGTFISVTIVFGPEAVIIEVLPVFFYPLFGWSGVCTIVIEL
jgi:hypothetical protein